MLCIKPSTIPGAGMGLFTTHPIKKGEEIVEYVGEIVTWAECEKRVKGVKGARYKKSLSSDNEEEIVREFETLQ